MSVELRLCGGIYRPGQAAPAADSHLALGRVFDPGPEGQAAFLARVAKDPGSLNGRESDLALAWHDGAQDRLILVRDGCGLSPLFYARMAGGGWAFAFDLKELFEIIGEVPPLDEATFYDFCATHYRHVFRDPGRTFHQGVRQVPAGFSVSIGADGAAERRWLRLGFIPEVAMMPPQEASELYVGHLASAVRSRLAALSGENFGFTVSSGMDSASVAALAARELGRPLETWFMAYRDQPESPFDETPGVEALIKATGWKLNRVDLTAPDLLHETKKLMEQVRAPIITVTWLAHHVLATKARAFGHKFLFSGLGGDESLAGEFEHFFVFFADLKAAGKLDLLERETAAWMRLHDHPVHKKSPEVRDDWLKRNVNFETGGIRVDRRRYTAFREYFDPGWVEIREAAAPPIPMPRPYPFFLSNRLFQEMSCETSPPTLWSEALSSRAAGIKGVFPMTSHKCLATALSAPGTSKYENGITKMLLRRAMAGILPDCSRLNPVKTGFNAPLDLWLRGKKLNDDCRDLLSSQKFRSLGWLAPGAADRILDQHLSGERDLMMLLWPLISTALFLELA